VIKTILGAAFVFILINLAIYGSISFIMWNANPGTWTLDSRFFQVILGIIFGSAAASAYIMFKNEG
jgi:hypothetical protein